MNTRVALLIPTMNRPDFLLRHFRFYDLTNSPHPLYISDSSNEENAKKIQEYIRQFKKLDITYQWVPPGKDCLNQLLPLIKEKYSIHIGDDDLIIPETFTECAEFLETHPNYATCAGKQINIRFRKEEYNKPYGFIDRHASTLDGPLEDEDMLVRVKKFWSDPSFINFSVRRVETERKIRNITKNFSLMEHFFEFITPTILSFSGKRKVLDRLGYVMQVSGIRYDFMNELAIDYLLLPSLGEKWEIVRNGLSEILQELGKTKEESPRIAKWMFILYLAQQFNRETSWLSTSDEKIQKSTQESLKKKIKHLIAGVPVLKNIYHKFNPSKDITVPGSKYFKDFRVVKDFLENN